MITFCSTPKVNYPGATAVVLNGRYYVTTPLQSPSFVVIGPKDQDAISSIINPNLPIYGIDINSKFEIKPGQKNGTNEAI